MRTSCCTASLLWLACLGLVPSTAAEPAEPLSVEAAVAAALAHSPALQAADEAVAAAEHAAQAAGALPAMELEVAPLVSDERGLDIEATVSQTLFDPVRSPAARAARTALAQAVAERDKVRLQVAGQAAASYHRLAAASRLAAATAVDVELAQQLVSAAAAAKELGERPGVDVLRAELELDLAGQTLSELRAEIDQARLALNSLLGRDLTGEPVIDALSSPVQPKLNRDALLAKAMDRPDLAAAALRVSERQRTAAAIRAERGPTVAVQGFREDQEHGLRLSLSLPVLDHGRIDGAARAVDAEARAAAQALADAQRAVALEVEQARLAVQAAGAQRDAYRNGALAKAERLTELTIKGYRLGELSLLEVLDAQRRLAEARRQAVVLDQALVSALLDLQAATGSSWLVLAPTETATAPPAALPSAADRTYGPPAPSTVSVQPTTGPQGGQP